MQGDSLLDQWKKAKQICQKIIQIAKNANLYNKVNESKMQKLTNRQFISVYDTVYKLCINKQKQQTRVSMVYKDFKDILKNGLLSMSQQLINQKDIYKLKYIRKIWQAYSDILKRLMHMFAYLNRPFHIKQGRIQQLQKTGLGIMVSTLFNQTMIQEYQSIYFKQIQRIRKTKDFINALILKELVDILYKIHLKLIKNINKKAITRYTQFHSKYLKNARQFYHKKHNLLKQLNPSQYFEQIKNIYQAQVKINIQCFGIGGQNLTNKQFTDQFIQKYRQTLLNSPKGFKSILHNKQIKTLKTIIQMYSNLTKNVDKFKDQFQEYIYQDIKSFMEQAKNQILIKKNPNTYCTFIQKIINKMKQYLLILEQSFMHLGDFISYYKSGVQTAFKAVKLPIAIQQLLAIYIDNKFKLTNLQENQVQRNFKNIMNVFTCIENKDLFLMRYTQKLAKKLPTITPQIVKNHQIFIQNLKLNCGLKFTERLETLVYENSLIYEYEPILKKILQDKKIKIDFNVHIYSQGAWPVTNITDIPLHYFPKQMEQAYQCLQIYREKYNTKKTFKISFVQSKMRWLYYFDKKVQNNFSQCYFDTNCLQGALLYFIYQKRPQKVNFSILEKFHQKINSKTIKQNLNKMAQITQNILIRTVIDGQTFYQFNQNMISTKRLISYQTITMNQQQRLFQQQDLGKDRQIVLDANIAKLMKSKKVIDFEILFNQITKMIKTFNPQKKDIKIAIDRLISKELLQRDQKDMNKIKYIQ